MKVWKSLELKPEKYLHLKQGYLSLWLESQNQEWRVGFNHDNDVQAGFSETYTKKIPEDLTWTRWVFPSDIHTLGLNPVMQDRPLVVRPEFNMKIPGGVKADFHVGIPVWLQFLSEKDKKVFEVPSEILSNTWFGLMESGELCYSLKSSILADSEPLRPFTHKAICPISITNESNEDLELQRICIQVKHLSVFQGEDRLWTNRVRIAYKGEEHTSSVTVDNKAPGPKSEFDLLTGPREKITGSFVKKTFSSIREMAGI